MMKQLHIGHQTSHLQAATSGVGEIKEGAQSRVYDQGDFVIKVPVPPEAMLTKARGHPWFHEATIDSMQVQYTHSVEHHRSVERYLATSPELRRLCADFSLQPDDCVRQTKVAVLDHLGDKDKLTENEAELRRLIDDFAALHLAIWKQRACELECSALTNCGRNRQTGELLLIDAGNLSFKFEDAVESVGSPLSLMRAREYMSTDRRPLDGELLPDWFSRGQLRELFWLHPPLFDYYITKMSSTLTQETLSHSWNAST